MTHSHRNILITIVTAVVIVIALGATYWYIQDRQNLQNSSKGVFNSDNLNKINTTGNPTNAAVEAAK